MPAAAIRFATGVLAGTVVASESGTTSKDGTDSKQCGPAEKPTATGFHENIDLAIKTARDRMITSHNMY